VKYIVNCRFATQSTTGVQRYALECAKILKDILGDSVVFIAPKGIINLKIKEELKIKQIGLFKGHLWEQINLPLYSFMNSATLFCFCGMPPILYNRLIYTIHDLSFIRHPEFFNYFYQFFYKIFTKIAYKRCMRISTVSEFTRKELIDVYGPREIDIVNNSISHLTGKNIRPVLPNFLMNCDFILTVGSLDPRKNIQKLINVFIREELDVTLVIVGKKNSVFSGDGIKAPNLKNVIFTGYLADDELAACYINAKCFFYPSMYEGFGIPPLEAIFYGTPVAVSDIPVHREVLKEYVHYFSLDKFEGLNEIIECAIRKKSYENFGPNHPLERRYNQQNQIDQIKAIVCK
jgi:glycosyltransferase involved in cell wall biosynthesis